MREGQRIRMYDPYYGISSVGQILAIKNDPQTLDAYGEPLVKLHITTFKGRQRWTDLWYLPLSELEKRLERSESADAGTPADPKRREDQGSW